jgi:5'(3')-deoxyribonucleotidase
MTSDQIWDNLIKNTKSSSGIPYASELKEAIKLTNGYKDRLIKILDFYYYRISEAFIEGNFGTIADLSKSNCLIDKETIEEANNVLKDLGYKIIEVDVDKFLIRWD